MNARFRVRTRNDGGFTLVELAVVVAIVGILSVIAVVGYRKYITNSKITEAQAMISAIRIAQEDRRAEAGTYANIGETYCPSGAPLFGAAFAWTPNCPSGATPNFTSLAVHNDGPVQFGYKTKAGTDAATFAAPTETTFVNWTAATSRPGPWYTIVAKADLTEGTSDMTELVGSSFSNQIWSYKPGE